MVLIQLWYNFWGLAVGGLNELIYYKSLWHIVSIQSVSYVTQWGSAIINYIVIHHYYWCYYWFLFKIVIIDCIIIHHYYYWKCKKLNQIDLNSNHKPTL